MKAKIKNIFTILLLLLAMVSCSESEPNDDCDSEKFNAFNTNPTSETCNAYRVAWLDSYNILKECGRSNAQLDAEKPKVESLNCSFFGGGSGGGTGGGSSNGNVMFWTKNSTIGAITVIFNGQAKQITQYQISGNPSSCGVSGFANYNLAAGYYSFSASSTSGVEWSGTINVPTNNGCFLQELTYSGTGGGDTGGSTTGHLTVWSSNTSVGTITVTCGGQTKYITSKYSSEPNCEASGCAIFDLPFGTYTINAKASNGASWNPYSMTINTTGQCYMLGLQ
jgi:hypothetical protein